MDMYGNRHDKLVKLRASAGLRQCSATVHIKISLLSFKYFSECCLTCVFARVIQ